MKNWYRIEFYDDDPLSVRMRVHEWYSIQHRLAFVERQYSTFNKAEAAANKMQRRYKNCVGYSITRL